MKKIFNLLVVCCLAALTACAQNTKKENKNMSKSLVAYFSATGTTAEVAKRLAQAADADLHEIKPEKRYTADDLDWTNKQSRSTLEMNDRKGRPAIVKDLQHVEAYDTLYVGFPIWWYTAPTLINTFLESYDLKGKTIILFATSGGSTPDKALKDLKTQYPALHFKAARLLNGASDQELAQWVKSLR